MTPLILSAAKNLSAPVLAAILCARPAIAQSSSQSFEVTPVAVTATVGDSVTVRFRIRLHERDQLLDSVPQVVGDLTPGVRVLSVDRLSRSASRVYEGSARLAFYRPGRRPVPIFGVPFMRVVEGVSRAVLPSDSAYVDITPVLSAGGTALKDIKELEPRPISLLGRLTVLALGIIAAGGLVLLLRRRRARSLPVVAEPDSPPEPVPPSPYSIAMERLDALERERWPARGNVALHYETVAQVLRQYLEHAYGVGALERTTPELLWALPPHLSRRGLRDHCYEVLAEADLVKFAEVRPTEPQASDFLSRARQLLISWHEAAGAEETVDAPR